MAVVGPRPAQPALPQQRSGLGRRGRERESNWWAAALHAPCWGGGVAVMGQGSSITSSWDEGGGCCMCVYVCVAATS